MLFNHFNIDSTQFGLGFTTDDVLHGAHRSTSTSPNIHLTRKG